MSQEINPIILAAFGPPPPGLDLAESQEMAITVVAIVCTIVATIALGLRIWARSLQSFGMKADDWLMVVALIFTFGTLAITILGARAGAGQHVWALQPQDVSQIFKLLFAYTYVYAGSVSFTKLSILLFYRRLFERGTKWFHIRLAIASFLCIGYPVTIWGVASGLCRPASYFWTQFIGETGECISINASFLSLTAINMVNDIVVLVVPLPEIMQLQMSFKRKIAVCGIMLLGSFVCVASVVRIWAFVEFTRATDITWVQAQVFLWSSVEPACGIVSACLPNLRPLFRLAKKNLSSNPGGNSSAAYGYGTKSSRVGNTYIRFGTGDDASVKNDDEVALTSISKAGTAGSNLPAKGIVVRSDIHQVNSPNDFN